MRLKLKSKNIQNKIFLFCVFLSGIISLLVFIFNLTWNSLDYRAADAFYNYIIRENKGPQPSGQIVFLNITDRSYNHIKSSYLNRKLLAEINNILSGLGTNAVLYDMIFPRASNEEEDSVFAGSFKELGNVYLPAGFELVNEKVNFRWENDLFYSLLRKNYLADLKTSGSGSPFYSKRVVPQKDLFAEAAHNTGHISIVYDSDGVLRHFPLIIKVDSLYFPAVSLSIILDYNRIPFDKIEINWGESIKIPAIEEGLLDEDMIIPIDDEGRIFIPYYSYWNDGRTKMMEAQSLLEYHKDHENLNDLLDFFESNFIFISDVSVGTTDIGQTTLEENTPLVTVHASLLNAFLTNKFYSKWDSASTAVIIFFLGILLGLSALVRTNFTLYLTGIILIAGLILFSYFLILNFSLFPLTTAAGSVLFIFIGILIGLYFFVSKEQTFIKNAFSKYVPGKVVNELLEKPELLKLGGEERVLTILFSDIAGFTAISESMKSTDLVAMLNDYLTEMTKILINQGGTIDKYIGDAILAEFGAPIKMEDHAGSAVTSALLMQRRLKELAEHWSAKRYPLIKSRIGINTGNIILGNMGSDQVFDYTVIGDPVNLAARLETANKFYNTEILISEFTFSELKQEKFRTRVVDIIKVKGKSNAVKVYEVYGFADEKIKDEDYYLFYDEGFNHYLKRDFVKAKDSFAKAFNVKQNDSAAGGMLTRIETLRNGTLDEKWDGSYTLTEK